MTEPDYGQAPNVGETGIPDQIADSAMEVQTKLLRERLLI
jgi:hypothetical protein